MGGGGVGPGEAPSHPRFEIVQEEGPSHGDVYEMDIEYEWRVVELASGKAILGFRGTWHAKLGDDGTWEPTGWTGVARVGFSADLAAVLVWEGGRDEPRRVELPPQA